MRHSYCSRCVYNTNCLFTWSRRRVMCPSFFSRKDDAEATEKRRDAARRRKVDNRAERTEQKKQTTQDRRAQREAKAKVIHLDLIEVAQQNTAQ